MEFGILGTLTVAEGDAEIAVPGVRLRTLLALLIVADGATVTPERLADDLWGEAIPAGAANALQSLISKLRRTLGDGDRVVTDPLGYRLVVAPGAVDARRFEADLAAGQAALAEGDAPAAATRLAAGLARWRGPALDGLADDGALRVESLRLEELHVTALEERCEADLRCGRHVELVAELQTLTAAHPVRERFHGQLMLALYRSGRQAEALRACQDAREMLADELGLDPGVELQELESAILAQDPALLPSETAAPPGGSTGAPRLGAMLSRFVGRVTEIEELGALVDDHRLVTVIGPGGAGKTRLSIEVASHRPTADAVWLVELAPITEAGDVADAVAAGVGVADGIPLAGTSGATATIDRLIKHIGTGRALLVLDNCEHVIDEAARVAESLLVACPNLGILATSREALAIGGETVWPIPAMAIEDAVELFADRAGATSAFVLDAESEVVVGDVCTRLDGLPLAVELAAGHVRRDPRHAARLAPRRPVQAAQGRCPDRAPPPTDPACGRRMELRPVVRRRAPHLRAVVRLRRWMLPRSRGSGVRGRRRRRRGRRRSAHAPRGQVAGDGHAARWRRRFDLLQTLALYGRERLEAMGDADATRKRHVHHFAELSARGDAAFRGDDQVAWLREVQREQDNLRAALGWVIDRGDVQAALVMLAGLGWSWWFSGRGREGWQWFIAALDLPGETDPKTRATAAMWAGFVGANAGQGIDAAMVLADQAVAAFRELDDRRSLGDATMLLASIAAGSGRNEEAIARFDEAGALYAVFNDDFSRGVTANARGRSAWVRGDLELADRLQRESVRYFKAAGVEWANALVNDDIAVVAEMRGDIPAAIEGTQGAREAARYLGLRGAEAMLLARLGNYALALGNPSEAERLHGESIALAEEVGFNWARGMALNGRAMCCRATGELDTAVECAEEAREIYRAAGVPPGEVLALASLGFVAERHGDVESARRYHGESLALARDMDDPRSIALAYEGLAGVAVLEGNGEHAAALLGAADALRAQVGGAPAGPASDVDRVTAAIRARCDEDDYADAFARGAAEPLAVVS